LLIAVWFGRLAVQPKEAEMLMKKVAVLTATARVVSS
jgi:hypothetical protein